MCWSWIVETCLGDLGKVMVDVEKKGVKNGDAKGNNEEVHGRRQDA